MCLNSNCEICCEFFAFQQYVRSLSVHKLHVNVSNFSILKWEIATFILSRLWPLHPDLNPVNYKICTEMQQRVSLTKVNNVNGPTLWYGFHCFQQHWALSISERLRVCSCKRMAFCVFNLTADYTFLHFNASLWQNLQVI